GPGAPAHGDLATGWASAELHPGSERARLSAEVFATDGAAALMYGEPDGLWALREEVARRGAIAGFATGAEEIVVTTGGRQAIDLVCRTILRPGDIAVTESPTYMGAMASMQDCGARVLGVPYVDSLSKTIGGGLRLGWVAASGEIRRRLTELKLGTDYHSALLPQHLAQRWLASGAHDRHLRRINAVYARRCQGMLLSLQRRL